MLIDQKIPLGQYIASFVEWLTQNGANYFDAIAQGLEMTFDQAFAMAGILAIDHHKIELVARNQPRQPIGNAVPAGPAHHVAQKK